ncbi:hypothetical protein PFISCL1PPCAC_15354, partial [Pristionchus fissidentatus]
GDSGGPLVVKSEGGRWYQIGVTSFGINEDEYIMQQDIAPGVFTNVEMYCDWIEEKTRGEAKCRSESAELVDAFSAATNIFTL